MNSRRTPFTASGESEILDLEGDMYLGGLPENRAGLILPTELWTAMLNYGYVGCIRDLFIDGRSKNIRQLAEMQNAAGVKSSCSRMSAKQCDSYPCKNNAVCKDGWNRFICDCTGTGYWGRTCERGESAARVAWLVGPMGVATPVMSVDRLLLSLLPQVLTSDLPVLTFF